MGSRLRVTATGDALCTRRLNAHKDEPYLKLIELIRSCDLAFTNLEVVLSSFRGSPVVESGGFHLSTDPAIARDLMWMGFNCTAFANNHTYNYGEEGILLTLEALRALEFPCAGAGRNLAEARMPAYIETDPARVGLVACCSTFAPGQRAGEQRPDLQGRPGLNPLRYKTTYLVDEEAMATIKRIAEGTGVEAERQLRLKLGFAKPPKDPDEFPFQGLTFKVGPEMGVRTEPNETDLREICRWVEEVKRQADFCLVSVHAHESHGERWRPAAFLETFARACVDAGADMVVGHGPHVLRGLELYRGKPIFYSVGNFIFYNEYTQRLAAEDYESQEADMRLTPGELHDVRCAKGEKGFPSDPLYWETVLPIVEFEGRTLAGIDLYPVTLGFGLPRPKRGRPVLASGEQARKTLDWFAELSGAYGTEIAVDGEQARVKL